MKPAKLYKKKAPKQGREKETRVLGQSPAKQIAQKRRATRRKGNHERPNPPPVTFIKYLLGKMGDTYLKSS